MSKMLRPVCKMGQHKINIYGMDAVKDLTGRVAYHAKYRQCSKCWKKFGLVKVQAEGTASSEIRVCGSCRAAMHKFCPKKDCMCDCERGL